MKQVCRQSREERAIVGLVPTGGSLHAGHFSLIEIARRQCSRVVVSIFEDPNFADPRVAPATQEGEASQSLDADCAALESLAVNYLFAPSAEELYPPGFSTAVVLGEMAGRFEGRMNPGRFRAVATQVMKLFQIVQPTFVYAGRFHAQEAFLLRRMIRDLNLDTEMVVCPIVREQDGVAVSSRNRLLNDAERRAATVLYGALTAARERIARGERGTGPLVDELRRVLESEPLASVDYAEIVDADTFQPAPFLRGAKLAIVATFFGSTRLIDNMLIEDRGGELTCSV